MPLTAGTALESPNRRSLWKRLCGLSPIVLKRKSCTKRGAQTPNFKPKPPKMDLVTWTLGDDSVPKHKTVRAILVLRVTSPLTMYTHRSSPMHLILNRISREGKSYRSSDGLWVDFTPRMEALISTATLCACTPSTQSFTRFFFTAFSAPVAVSRALIPHTLKLSLNTTSASPTQSSSSLSLPT